MRLTSLLLAVCVATLPVAAVAQQRGLPKGETRVVRVIDGDTIAVSDLRAHVRLRGIDAPEIHKNVRTGYKCDQERELGLKAKAALQDLLSGDHKVVVKHTQDFDQYGRRLAVVTSDGKDAGQELVHQGLAQSWDGQGPRPDWCSNPQRRRK